MRPAVSTRSQASGMPPPVTTAERSISEVSAGHQALMPSEEAVRFARALRTSLRSSEVQHPHVGHNGGRYRADPEQLTSRAPWECCAADLHQRVRPASEQWRLPTNCQPSDAAI